MPTKEEIEKLAYRLWEEEGMPEGRAVAHYFEAERLLLEREQAAARTRQFPTTTQPAKPPHRLPVRPTIARRPAPGRG